jgi:hypothetical protein
VAVSNQSLSKDRKAAISEAAVLFRLALHGFQVSMPVSDGAKPDWLVTVDGRSVKIQVKTVSCKPSQYGLPCISLLCHGYRSKNKTRRYSRGEFDFIVGYDLYSDRLRLLGRRGFLPQDFRYD